MSKSQSPTPMDEVKVEYEAAMRTPKLFPETPTEELFDHVMAVFGDSPALECVRILMDNSYNDLTINEVQALTGLTKVYIRRRVQEGRWADPRTYDDRGRLLIPAVEVESYLQARSAKEGTAYIIRLSPAEAATFNETFPDKPLTPRYDPEKARKYRARKAAEASARGVKLGKLNL